MTDPRNPYEPDSSLEGDQRTWERWRACETTFTLKERKLPTWLWVLFLVGVGLVAWFVKL